MDKNNKIENSVKNSSQNEKKEEISAYSQELINDVRDLSTRLFPNEKNIKKQESLDDISLNKELFRTCILSILKDMNPEEKKSFRENPGDFKNVLLLSTEKAQLSEEIKNSIKEKINSITMDDFISQSLVVDKLDLLNLEGDICKMEEKLYESLKGNPEVAQAHAYLNLTEK